MEQAGGKLALSKQSVAAVLGSKDQSIVDFLGYGTANDSLSKPAVPGGMPGGTRTIARITNSGLDASVLGDGNGWNSNDNSKDFVAASPFPRNSSYITSNADLGVKSIADLRVNDEKGVPTKLSNKATIEGVVTAVKLGSEKTNFVIQDETSGIQVISANSSGDIQVGQKLKITGHVVFTKGLTHFVLESIVSTEEGTVPSPLKVDLADLSSYEKVEALEGKLVTIKGKVSNIPTVGTDLNITVEDEEKYGNCSSFRCYGY